MPEQEPLSQIIAKLNERVSTEWTARDRIHLDATFEDLASPPDIQRAAAVNTAGNSKRLMAAQSGRGAVTRRWVCVGG